MLRLAGCSSGRGVGARGGWRRGDVFLLRRRGERTPPASLCSATSPFRRGFWRRSSACASPERGGVAVGDGGVSLRVAFCARSRLPRVPLGMSCVQFTPTILFYWEVLRSFTPVSFPLSGKERRLAVSCVSIPRGSGSPLVCSHDFVRLSNFVGSLLACAFLCGDPDGERRDAEYEERNRRRGVGTLLRKPINLAMFSAGSTLGAARPQTCAKESSTL